MNQATKIVGCLLLTAGILFLGFRVDRTEFWEVLLGFIAAFSGYFLLVRSEFPSLKTLLILGLVLRVILVFAFPLLSDDIYRFIWDGQLINAGINPFSELPAFYLEQENSVPVLTQELFSKLNSPGFYTIYPPVAQGVFTFATWVSPGSWWGAAVVMKLFLIITELGTALLLWSLLPLWNTPRKNLLFYWLNPLIIIEICGNLHFEGLMVCFLLLAFWCFYKAGVLPEGFELHILRSRRIGRSKSIERKQSSSPTRFLVLAALAFAFSVASKLLTLMFLPFLIVRLWKNGNSRPFWIFSIAFGLFNLLLFLPLLSSGFLSGFGSSLDLYFRNFEFNASLYFLAREYGYYEIGWNQIARFGPLLAKVALVSILIFALVEGVLMNGTIVRLKAWWREYYAKISVTYYPVSAKAATPFPTFVLPTSLLFAFVIYLLCATTVHPWYLSLPIVLCCFGNWRFPLVWSFFIVLTYTSYTIEPYQENLWLVAVEYVAILLFFAWELLKNLKIQDSRF